MEIRGIYGAKLAYEPADQETRKGAVVICPGGGYGYLSPREAEPVAEAFREKGYMPLILYYDVESPVLGTRPMEQAAWAVRHARELQPGGPVFICGFSAGGHLAASLGVHWDDQAVFDPEEWIDSLLSRDYSGAQGASGKHTAPGGRGRLDVFWPGTVCQQEYSPCLSVAYGRGRDGTCRKQPAVRGASLRK